MTVKNGKRPPRRTEEPVCAQGPAVNLDESPLAWLARRKDKDGQPLLSEAEVNAGERLRADFWFAQMTPRVTSNWSRLTNDVTAKRGPLAHGIEIADHVVAARERVRLALKAAGPDLAGMLIDVCCYLQGIEEAERAGGWPQRSGKVVLRIALRQLARHYGFIDADGMRHASRARASHWGAPDYRPVISGDDGGA